MVPPMRAGGVPGGDWSISDVPERQCSAHQRDGIRCKNAAIQGGTVCGYHGGNAPAVKAKARLRLEMASDRLARQLLNVTTDPNVADRVKLAAIKDALDRSGLAAKNAVSVEVGITKPWKPFSRESPKSSLVQEIPRTQPAQQSNRIHRRRNRIRRRDHWGD